MDKDTFRSRLMRLMQKSRQAFRLYDSMGRSHTGTLHSSESAEFTEAQASEWRTVNGFLIKQLSLALENPHPRALASQVISLRRHFWEEFRGAESELHTQQRELVAVSEKGDFVRAALVSRALVALKARMQAAQAAHHELDDLVQKSRLSDATIALTDEQVVSEANLEARSVSNLTIASSTSSNVTGPDVAAAAGRGSRAAQRKVHAAQREFAPAKIIPLRKRL